MRRNNIIVTVIQIEVENKDVFILVHDLEVDTGTSKVGKKLDTEDIFDHESEIKSSSSEEGVIRLKPVILDAWKSSQESAGPSQVSLEIGKISAVDLKDSKLDIVSVDSGESIQSLDQTNSEGYVKTVEPNKFVLQPMEVKDFKAGAEDSDNISL